MLNDFFIHKEILSLWLDKDLPKLLNMLPEAFVRELRKKCDLCLEEQRAYRKKALYEVLNMTKDLNNGNE